MDMRDKVKELAEEREKLLNVPSKEAVDRQHKRGKLTARERVDHLFDPGTFWESNAWAKPKTTGFDIDQEDIRGDAVVTGYGMIDGRPVCAYSQDFTVVGGTVATVHAKKTMRLMRQALDMRVPVINIIDSGGVRIQDAVTRDFNDAYPAYFNMHTYLSGVIPQIGLLMGPCAAGAAYSPILTDFLIMVKGPGRYMYIASPTLLKSVQFVDVTDEQLGGADVHARISGCCDVTAADDDDCLQKARELLSYLPAHNQEKPPVVNTGDDPERRDDGILDVVPIDSRKAYDMHNVIKFIVDKGIFYEIKKEYARNMITGFARLDGKTIGIVANNPMHLAGAIDINASDKEARFIRFCDCFNIPLVFLVDNPAYLPGVEQEHGGIIRHGAKVLHAIGEATVPKLTVYVRKAFGGGVPAMCSEPMGADLLLAWPTALMGVMGADGAVNIIYRKEIASAPNPKELFQKRLAEYNATMGRFPYHAANMRWAEDIIDPRDTRRMLVHALKAYADKKQDRPWRKHSNIPM